MRRARVSNKDVVLLEKDRAERERGSGFGGSARLRRVLGISSVS